MWLTSAATFLLREWNRTSSPVPTASTSSASTSRATCMTVPTPAPRNFTSTSLAADSRPWKNSVLASTERGRATRMSSSRVVSGHGFTRWRMRLLLGRRLVRLRLIGHGGTSLDLDHDGGGERVVPGEDGPFHAVPARSETPVVLGLVRDRGVPGAEPLHADDLEE